MLYKAAQGIYKEPKEATISGPGVVVWLYSSYPGGWHLILKLPMNYWQIQKQDRTLSAASHLLIEDTDDPETNLLVNRIHFGKMFAPHRKLTKQSILILSFSTHFNLLHQRHSKSARSSGLSLFALSLCL
ncbi:hypothetical protein CMV_009362 [Castanea mollissima]|uniref:Uncharacterized protein n=1 Tax=Castanea mollissima TaxID=60419 RepID=A0A8J4RPE9_9ROSI|nr:hypothetical protein CMV_009362 [Castanea mollissima]